MSRSIKAVAQVALGNTVFQSLNARLVVKRTERFSYLRLTTWKRRSAARLS
jgi:hypothetical protein